MTLRTVGIMAPGEMGHAIGRVLRVGGLRVITCLQGRSARTAARAAAAGIEVVTDDAALVREAVSCWRSSRRPMRGPWRSA